MNPISKGVRETPCMIYDEERILGQASALTDAIAGCCTTLYSLKACNIVSIISMLARKGFGFSVSSLFEARLVRETRCDSYVHFVSPSGAVGDVAEVARLCDSITFNSIGQFQRYSSSPFRSMGLRVNPGYTPIVDDRYNPCRKHSKLGASVADTYRALSDGMLPGISGLHFHNACGVRSWSPLLQTVDALEKQLRDVLHMFRWFNFGGGYVWDEEADFGPLREAVQMLYHKHGLQVFVEPGAGIVDSAGYLIAEVIDLFESDGKWVAVLDTTVNHLPEVFEYQYEPDVVEHIDGSPYEYVLAGCSCLAGDLFGEYSFNEPLEIGRRVTFRNVGAYTLVKANMFNGINLPSIYTINAAGELSLVKRFGYEDFSSRCGVDVNAAVGT